MPMKPGLDINTKDLNEEITVKGTRGSFAVLMLMSLCGSDLVRGDLVGALQVAHDTVDFLGKRRYNYALLTTGISSIYSQIETSYPPITIEQVEKELTEFDAQRS